MIDDDSDDEDTTSTLPRRQLGRLLRQAREGTGMSLEHAARLMEWGKSTLGRLERGEKDSVRDREIDDLVDLYGVDEEKAAAIRQLAGQAPTRPWWRSYNDVMTAKFNIYVGLEAGAEAVAIFQPIIVPGLVQTASYARALDRKFFSEDSDENIERRVDLRLKRQHLIKRRRKPVELTVVLHESVLRTIVGNRRVMAEQLRYLLDLSSRDNIRIRILRFSAGFPTGTVVSQFILLVFPKDAKGKPVEPTIVFVESFAGDAYLEQNDDVRRCRETFRTLWDAAMDDRASRTFIRELAREYENER
ncbi:helix-turn-helix domain-containing protein [Nocardia terpenica]|uniref:Transcriptional regulator n=1 Tax=Nocardia terpenica TaxID=455432 RepID=A0A291RL93_9NOCA|nr:helix-turn-helix transcriptional regulator [Nocardia terpenica]ATL68060.1 transcriptional regulator [Nocardia terpenica]